MTKTRFLTALLGGAAAVAITPATYADDDLSEQDTIVITTPLGKSIDEALQSVDVITDEQLERLRSGTLGETLQNLPGVTASSFGPGASRPIIRGQGDRRIAVLDAGIDPLDAAVTSADHAVVIDPALAERIELIRGPGVLRFGSSAAGGVVNVFDGRIPDGALDDPDGFEGAVRAAYDSVSDGTEFAGGLNAQAEDFVFHLSGFARDAGDIDIPGFAESAALRALEEAEEEEGEDHSDEEEVRDTLENSDLETYGINAGASVLFDGGFLGFGVSAFDSEYGLPGGHEHEEGEEEEEEGEEEGGVRIDMESIRYDFAGEIARDVGAFERFAFRVGYTDYEHSEIEPNGEVASTFLNDGFDARLEAFQRDQDGWTGVVGVQIKDNEFEGFGEESFVGDPPIDNLSVGVFSVQEFDRGATTYEIGGRLEYTEREQSGVADLDFTTISLSAGVGHEVSETVFLGVTGFRTERAPALEELFSNGAHLATNAFEVGDITLDKEVALGLEGALRFSGERARAAFTPYVTFYEDFIIDIPTGAVDDESGLPVFQFFATDATFVGFEVEGEVDTGQIGIFDASIDGGLDYVRATGDDFSDDDLPRIPPLKATLGFDLTSDAWDFRLEGVFAAEQGDVAEFELKTDGYTVGNAYATWRPNGDNLAFELSARNFTDEEVRLHSSFLKDIAPQAGANVRLGVRAAF